MAEGIPLRSVESKPQVVFPSLQQQIQKVHRYHPAGKSGRVALCQSGTDGDTKSCLKGHHINFHMQPLTLGSGKDGTEWTRETGDGGFGGRIGRAAAGILVLSHLILQEPSYSGRPLCSKWHQPEGKQ